MEMEPSRRHEEQHAPAEDALTSLPAHLLDEILTRVGLRDAVRTSALSRAWRLRWESLPALSLSFLDCPDTPPAVVDSILVRYAGRISFEFDPGSVSVDHWVIALSRRGVESIDLRSSSCYPFALHSSIFSCGHLVSLELHHCRFPPLPAGFAGFPSLRELNLTDVEFVDNEENQVEPIIRQSPLLEVLKLSSVVISCEEDWVIQAPNLRSLAIISEYYYGWQIDELSRLDDATIGLETYVEEHDFGKFLAGIAHVRKLTISIGYQPMDDDEEQEFEANAEFQNTSCTNGLCAHLQVVKMNGIGWLPNEICFIELVLAKATVLRTMSISLCDGSMKSNENALSELNAYQRASPHAQVFFKAE